MILAVRTKHLGERCPHIAPPRRAINFFLDNDRDLDPRPKLRFLLYLNPNLVEFLVRPHGGWRSDARPTRGGVGVGGQGRGLESYQGIGRLSSRGEDIPIPHPGPPPHRGEEAIPDLPRVTALSTGLIQILTIPASSGEPCLANQVSKSRPGARDLLIIPKKLPCSRGASGGDDVRGSLGASSNCPHEGRGRLLPPFPSWR
jgi:hypothetical protein